MNTDQKELTLQENLQQVMQTLPPFIRDYISQGKYTTVAQGLMSKYKLRIDQGGALERELLLLLMGIENPEEFTDALAKDAQLDEQTVNSIAKDINDQVFVPLRAEEERLSKASVQQQPKQVTPPAPARPAAPSAPHIAPLPPKMTMPTKASPLGDTLRSIMAPKPLDTAKLLKDHEEPHIEFKPAPVPTPAAPVAPKETVLASVAPSAPSSQSPVIPQPSATKIVPPVPPKAPPAPPIMSYSSDPYREPIDESSL